MNHNSLFRKEVLEQKTTLLYGAVCINRPDHYGILSFFIIAPVLILCGFVLLSESSAKIMARGYLNFSEPSILIYPQREGMIAKYYLNQRKHIKINEPLFLINTLPYEDEEDRKALECSFASRKSIFEKMIQEKKKSLNLLKRLLQKKYISLTQYRQQVNEMNILNERLSELNKEIIQNRQNRQYLIRSPIDGLVSHVWYKAPQYVVLGKPMMQIVPVNAPLLAHILLPADQAAILNKIDKISINFDAYPKASYGNIRAIVDEISAVPLLEGIEESPVKIKGPYYQIIAHLEQPYLWANRHKIDLHSGLTFTAVIDGNKEKLWRKLIF